MLAYQVPPSSVHVRRSAVSSHCFSALQMSGLVRVESHISKPSKSRNGHFPGASFGFCRTPDVPCQYKAEHYFQTLSRPQSRTSWRMFPWKSSDESSPQPPHKHSPNTNATPRGSWPRPFGSSPSRIFFAPPLLSYGRHTIITILSPPKKPEVIRRLTKCTLPRSLLQKPTYYCHTLRASLTSDHNPVANAYTRFLRGLIARTLAQYRSDTSLGQTNTRNQQRWAQTTLQTQPLLYNYPPAQPTLSWAWWTNRANLDFRKKNHMPSINLSNCCYTGSNVPASRSPYNFRAVESFQR